MGGAGMKIKVYHGSTVSIEHPDCSACRENLDFGKGFYLTDIREQAETWVRRVAERSDTSPMLNVYILDRNAILQQYSCKVFAAYNDEWLDFIVTSRQGQNPAADFDYVEGCVANDRVIDTINLYMSGLMSREIALQRLSEHKPNNQMCLLNQEMTDKFLEYEGTENI